MSLSQFRNYGSSLTVMVKYNEDWPRDGLGSGEKGIGAKETEKVTVMVMTMDCFHRCRVSAAMQMKDELA